MDTASKFVLQASGWNISTDSGGHLDYGITPYDRRTPSQERPYYSDVYLVCLSHLGWYVQRRPVQILDTPLIILTKLGRIGITVEGRHYSTRLQGMLQAQHMTKLMSSHL